MKYLRSQPVKTNKALVFKLTLTSLNEDCLIKLNPHCHSFSPLFPDLGFFTQIQVRVPASVNHIMGEQ